MYQLHYIVCSLSNAPSSHRPSGTGPAAGRLRVARTDRKWPNGDRARQNQRGPPCWCRVYASLSSSEDLSSESCRRQRRRNKRNGCDPCVICAIAWGLYSKMRYRRLTATLGTRVANDDDHDTVFELGLFKAVADHLVDHSLWSSRWSSRIYHWKWKWKYQKCFFEIAVRCQNISLSANVIRKKPTSH